MTISSTARKAGPFSGTGLQSAYPFNFKVFTASDVLVVQTDASGVEHPLSLTTDYTVNLNSDQDGNPGGTVTLKANLPAGYLATVSSVVPLTQATSIPSMGGFYPKVIEQALDKLTIAAQQVAGLAGRGLRFALSDPTPQGDLPTAAVRAGKFLAFDAGGNPSAASGTGADAALRTDLASPAGGASLVGVILGSLGTVARSLLDKLRERPTVFDYMTQAQRDDCSSNTASMDVSDAVQKAFNSGVGLFPPGSFKLSKKITTPINLAIIGAGGRRTTILAAENFNGDTVFECGSPTVLYGVPSVSASGLVIDLQGNVDAGITCYGLQDGSTFDQVYIRGIRKYGVRTRWSVSGSTYLMNEGLMFTNCHVLSRNDGGAVANGAYWDLSGLYESTLINCKALGYDARGASHTNVDGFRIGGVNTPGLVDADCQGIRLYNCSAANFIGLGNRALFFGNVFSSSADAPTIENVQGKAIVFGQGSAVGTASDQYSAAYCYVNAPRLYNPAASAVVHATAFEFSAVAAQCAVRNVPTFPSLAGQKLVSFLGTSQVCTVEILGANVAANAMAPYIDFTSANQSNVVRAFTSDTASKQASTYAPNQLTTERFANGTTLQHTQYYTELNLSTDWRFCKSDGTQIATIAANGTFKLNTAILPTNGFGDSGTVWRDAANGNALKIIP